MSEKYTFDDFLSTVDGDNREFVRELHEELTKLGCKTDKAGKKRLCRLLPSE